LQRAEEFVQLGEVGAEAGLLTLDGLNDGGEAVLDVEGWERDHQRAYLFRG
jgi:hypothetical protein